MAPPQAGDALPDITLFKTSPHDTVKIREVCAGKKVVIVGVPGAFTPTCSEAHLPSYTGHHEELKAAGIETVVFVAVNDPFVMTAWGKSQGVEGKIEMLADAKCELAEALDVVLDAVDLLGTKRCKRFAMLVDDNVIKALKVEDAPADTTCTLANHVLEILKSA